MRRAGRALLVLLGAAMGGALTPLAASCTTFNGVTFSRDAAALDTSFEGSLPEAATDAAGDSAGDASAGQGYLSVADAVRVCSLIFQCPTLAQSVITSVAVPVDPVNFSLCVHWLAAPMPGDRVGFAVQAQTFACMSQGATCAAAGSCLSVEYLGAGDPRCAAPDAGRDASADAEVGGDAGTGTLGRCGDDGGTVYHCEDSYLLHCGAAYYAPGSTCEVGADGERWCSLGEDCNSNTSCIGTLLTFCGAGDDLLQSVNCSYDGYTCDVASNSDSGSPECNTGTLEKPCGAEGTSCSGAVVEVCDGFDYSEFDCASQEASCSTKGGSALCVKLDDECTPFDADVNLCSGSSVTLCVGGRKQTFDCANIGFSCIAGEGAESSHCG